MDEPFSAIDPIARGRLQDEFLRVQAEVHKTILFVTHDIDEAVKLGDRIAVFRQGGFLEQFDTPARILGRPATPFVADFVGGERGLRRLSVTPIDRDALSPVNGTPQDAPKVFVGETLQEVMAELLATDAERVLVVEEDGRTLGCLTADGVRAALRRSVEEDRASWHASREGTAARPPELSKE
jgi:osmoprotectant transport system ATP-binding protein